MKLTVIIATRELDLYEKHLGILLWLGRCADIKVCKDFNPEGKLVKKDVSATTTVYVIGEVCYIMLSILGLCALARFMESGARVHHWPSECAQKVI